MARRLQRREKAIEKTTEAELDGPEMKGKRQEWWARSLDVSDWAALEKERDRYAATKSRMRLANRESLDPGGALPKSGAEVIAARASKLKVSMVKNPGPRPTWGHTGRYVKVEGEDLFELTRLRFSIDEKAVAHLDRRSVRLARWEPAARRFFVIPHSGFERNRGYVYGQITRPGIYTAVGVPRDPRLRSTLKLARVMRPWMKMHPGRGAYFQQRICRLIDCATFVDRAVGDPQALGKHGYSTSDFPGGYGGGNVCDQCHGTDFTVSPEIDILDGDEFEMPTTPSTWQNVGPVNVTGRIAALAIHPTDGNTLYAGASGGGVWKTTDGGSTWQPTMFDELSLAIGGLAISVTNPEVLYAGTGEWVGDPYPHDVLTRGVGVYRTTNGGATWTRCAPIPSTSCAAVAVDPTNEQVVFVGGNQGLHRSDDRGRTWNTRTFPGVVSDVVIDPVETNRVYIGVHLAGVYRSIDGGDTWDRLGLAHGLPVNDLAEAPKLALKTLDASRNRFVAAKLGGHVYVSIDGDAFNARGDLTAREWAFAWNNVIAVDPEHSDVLFAGGVNLYRSTNGGATWPSKVAGYDTNVHADMQAVVFDPTNHRRMYLATDGGIWRSQDNGRTWTFASRGLVATQLYSVSVSQTSAVRYGVTVQDDNAYAYRGGPDWVQLPNAEGGYLEYDPSDEAVLYADSAFQRDEDPPKFGLIRVIEGGDVTDLGIETAVWKTTWAEPLAISRQSSMRLLAVQVTSVYPLKTQIVRSANRGDSWTSVLDENVLFSCVRFAPTDDGVAYAASTQGRIWQLTPGRIRELNTDVLPDVKVQTIEVDRWDANRLYVAFAGMGHPHLWRGDVDASANVSWLDIGGGGDARLPDLPLTGFAQHPTFEGVLFVSNMVGVLRTASAGTSWAPFDEGLPNAFVSDLDVRERDVQLFASTFGRGLYCRSI